MLLKNGGQISVDTRGEGDAGNLLVQADLVEVTGTGSSLSAEVVSGATGRGGELRIETEQLNVRDQAQVTVSTAGSDPKSRAGNLTIDTGQLLISDGAQISASTSGAGAGGSLNIRARQEVELRGTGLENFDDAIKLALETSGDAKSLQEFIKDEAPLSTATFSTGEAGTIAIDTPALVLRDGAILSSTTFGGKKAGGIDINAESVELLGSGLVAGTFNSDSEASGGDIKIDTDKLSLQDGGRILTTTFSQGKGGNVDVTASESVELGLTPAGAILPTTINTSSVFGTGGAGQVTIKTATLIVQDGAQIVTTSGSDSLPETIKQGGAGGNIKVTASESVEISGTSPDDRLKSALTAESFSSSAAGNIEILSGSLTLDNQASILATTLSEDGGNIKLQIDDLLVLQSRSKISATAGIEGGSGNGGNIDIDADFIVAFPRNNQIIANAFFGTGGNIRIDTNFIFGFPDFLEIDASSQFGLSGTVAIRAPEFDPSQGLTELPEDVVDPAALIAQNPCTLGLESEFIITGRGGLPPSPDGVLSSDSARVSWVEPAPVESKGAKEQGSRGAGESTSIQNPQSKIPNPIVPARGWVFNDKGEAILVAYDPTNSGPQRLKENLAVCPAP